MSNPLTFKEHLLARRRRKASVSWEALKAELGTDMTADELRICVTEAHEKDKQRRKDWNERAAERAVAKQAENQNLRELQSAQHVAAPSITAAFCGDPPFHRSALSQRLNAMRTIHRDPLDGLIFRPHHH